MPAYVEYCPLGLTDKRIPFEIVGGRLPSPTKGCICGGTEQEQKIEQVVLDANLANLIQSLGDSILSEGKPVEYRSYTIRGGHDSVVEKVG